MLSVSQIPADYCFAVAPMIDWTDRHCRHFHRLMSKNAVLYTEMIVDKAILHGDAARLLAGADAKTVLQLGGSDPDELAAAARIATDHGYGEINLNCGCPSDRVQSGAFGAVLMKSPEIVARALEAIQNAVALPVSVKCRIGIDEDDPQERLPQFLKMVEGTGVGRVTVHARKAWLNGLSPKENRTIPPLDYPLVARMLNEFPALHIAINGGIETLEDGVNFRANGFAGVMYGRAAYHRPFDIIGHADAWFFGVDAKSNPPLSRREVVETMLPYIERVYAETGRVHPVTKHMLGLYHGEAGGRLWRQSLSSGAAKTPMDVLEACNKVEELREGRNE